MRFTTENAREYSARGNAIRWSREKAPPEPEAPVAIAPATPEVHPEEQTRQRALARVLVQLERLDAALDKASTDREWDMYTRAKERLGKFWFHLGGIAPPKAVAQSRAPRRAYTQQPLPQGWESTPDAAKQEQSNATQPNVAPKAPEASQ